MNMLKFLNYIPLMPFKFSFAEEGDKGGGEKEENKGETVSKADLDKAVGERDKFEKDLDDARAEIFTPAYMEYLDKKDIKPEEKKEEISDDKFEKMSKKEIFELATKTALDQFNTTRDKDLKDRKATNDASTQREIARFAKNHSDYDKFRPVMYGLSLLTENKDLGLQELYDKSKVHVKSLQEEPTEEEKKKHNAMGGGMKPGSSSGTYNFDKKVDGHTAANQAAEEVAESLGPLPNA